MIGRNDLHHTHITLKKIKRKEKKNGHDFLGFFGRSGSGGGEVAVYFPQNEKKIKNKNKNWPTLKA